MSRQSIPTAANLLPRQGHDVPNASHSREKDGNMTLLDYYIGACCVSKPARQRTSCNREEKPREVME